MKQCPFTRASKDNSTILLVSQTLRFSLWLCFVAQYWLAIVGFVWTWTYYQWKVVSNRNLYVWLDFWCRVWPVSWYFLVKILLLKVCFKSFSFGQYGGGIIVALPAYSTRAGRAELALLMLDVPLPLLLFRLYCCRNFFLSLWCLKCLFHVFSQSWFLFLRWKAFYSIILTLNLPIKGFWSIQSFSFLGDTRYVEICT